jgi:hypothetical protein
MPAAIPIIAAIVTTGGGIAAAKINSDTQKAAAKTTTDASTNATAASSAANANALAFQKAQAENEFQNSETTRKANYDQWAAQQQRMRQLDALIGVQPRAIPDYAPGVDPGFTGSKPSAAPPTAMNAAPAAAPVPNGDFQAAFQQITGGKPLDQKGLLALAPQLQAAGIQVTPPSAGGVVSKIGHPDGKGGMQWVRVLAGDTNVASPTVWIPQPTTAPTIGQMAMNPTRPNYAMPSLLSPTTPLTIGSFA